MRVIDLMHVGRPRVIGVWQLDDVLVDPGPTSRLETLLEALGDGTAFVGAAGGVRITPESLTIPPTPPPDIDVEAWHESIERIRAWRPRRLAMTHFGDSEDVDAQLDALGRRLDAWAERARE